MDDSTVANSQPFNSGDELQKYYIYTSSHKSLKEALRHMAIGYEGARSLDEEQAETMDMYLDDMVEFLDYHTNSKIIEALEKLKANIQQPKELKSGTVSRQEMLQSVLDIGFIKCHEVIDAAIEKYKSGGDK